MLNILQKVPRARARVSFLAITVQHGRWLSASAWSRNSEDVQQIDSDNHERPHVGIVTTSSPHQTAFSDLINHVKSPVWSDHIPSNPNEPASLALLITPSFARHALDPELPQKIAARLSNSERTFARPLKAIAAVVDRLPTRTDSSEEHEGREGFAYAFVPRGSLFDEASQANALQSSAKKPGSLFLDIKGLNNVSNSRDVAYRLQLQLPLAPTIFSTGLVSTLVYTSHTFDVSKNAIQTSEQQNLESQTLMGMFRGPNVEVVFHAPLVQLTTAAKITYCMGNIIRTVSPQSSRSIEPSNPQPASKELEEAILGYFKAMKEQPRPVNVWALVIPSEISTPATDDMLEVVSYLLDQTQESIHSRWQQGPTSALLNPMLGELFVNGARLCKVFSGGGGWGKKAGLLSLDPDVEYSTREVRGNDGWKFDFLDAEGIPLDEEKQKKQALGEIVRKDETVIFFLEANNVVSESPSTQTGAAAIFGTLPSSIDAVPESSLSKSEETKPTIAHQEHAFGMLSEGGLALTFTSNTEVPQQVLSKTKFDVPLCRVNVVLGGEYQINMPREKGLGETPGVGDNSQNDTKARQLNKPKKEQSNPVSVSDRNKVDTFELRKTPTSDLDGHTQITISKFERPDVVYRKHVSLAPYQQVDRTFAPHRNRQQESTLHNQQTPKPFTIRTHQSFSRQPEVMRPVPVHFQQRKRLIPHLRKVVTASTRIPTKEMRRRRLALYCLHEHAAREQLRPNHSRQNSWEMIQDRDGRVNEEQEKVESDAKTSSSVDTPKERLVGEVMAFVRSEREGLQAGA